MRAIRLGPLLCVKGGVRDVYSYGVMIGEGVGWALGGPGAAQGALGAPRGIPGGPWAPITSLTYLCPMPIVGVHTT